MNRQAPARHDEEFAPDLVPHRRTIQRVVKEFLPASSDEIWSLGEADGEEAKLILPVLKSIALSSDGKDTTLGSELASWIVRIRRLAPDLYERTAYNLALTYMHRTQAGEPTDELDLVLAFQTWKNKSNTMAFLQTMPVWPTQISPHNYILFVYPDVVREFLDRADDSVDLRAVVMRIYRALTGQEGPYDLLRWAPKDVDDSAETWGIDVSTQHLHREFIERFVNVSEEEATK